MKVIFIGDIHGKVEAVQRALDKSADQRIFVGDFMDSFDRPWYDHLKCLRLVLDAVKAGEADAIYGNHELSYLMPFHRCSGWSSQNENTMLQNRVEIEALFKPHILLAPDFLVTHAGLTSQLWKKKHLTLENLEENLTKWWPKISSPVHQIGNYRGGISSVGGTFWCDFKMEFNPIKGLTQVFGHTAGDGIRKKGESSFCIDCLDYKHEFLEMDL